MNRSTLFRKKSVTLIQRDAALGYTDAHGGEHGANALSKELGVYDLTSLGIAAVIGAGIFSTIGNAAYNGGPAVAFLFIFTAVACAFSALCYAEFASMIPVAGSAYTYAYASFGELVAWIIGWDLLMEYSIGNIAVAISWSDYFTGLLAGYGIDVPAFLTMDFLTASRGHAAVSALLAQGNTLEQVRAMPDVTSNMMNAYAAWSGAPRIAGLPIVADLPALIIVVLVTALVYVGIRESKRASNIMVALKVGVILLVIALGAFYIRPENWSPFAPNGVGGVLKGISAVFFAYIGFDAISTTAEECKNPQRDLPRGMIYSLIICTILYVAISLVITGMVSYSELQVGDPLAFVFQRVGLDWIAGIVAVSAVVAMSTVLLVFQLGQPRIWMAMSRDGLLPKIFASIHPRFHTPWFSTLVTGAVVAIPALFLNLTEVTDLTSIGTLFAFILVCGGVLVLQHNSPQLERKFRVPYVDSRFIVPALLIAIVLAGIVFRTSTFAGTFGFVDPANPSLGTWLSNTFGLTDPADPKVYGWEAFKHKIPFIGFCISSVALAVLCFRHRLSLIPVLGLLSCGYLISELGLVNWTRFSLWLLLGLVVYFLYGYRHSRLARPANEATPA